MLKGMFFVCLSLSLWTAGSSLSCRWMQHKFQQFSKNSLDLIDTMANNSTNTTVDAGVGFPYRLYKKAFHASAEDRLHFLVQILKEMVVLFEEDTSKASWEENTEETSSSRNKAFAHIGTHKKENRNLHRYFQRLSSHVLKKMDHSAEAWELIRNKMKSHLAEDKLSFTVQILEEMVVLFEEDNSKASWEEIREENFLQVIGSHSHKRKNKKIQMYFKRLSSHVLEQMDNSAEAWELIRKEMKTHLQYSSDTHSQQQGLEDDESILHLASPCLNRGFWEIGTSGFRATEQAIEGSGL
ncbi:hypothetical protein F7725_014569, partial [Dissostichus mawsoni]